MTNPFTQLLKEGKGLSPLNIEQAALLCDHLDSKLNKILDSKSNESGSDQVWATQGQLAKRFGFNGSSEISRILSRASRDNFKIATINCGESGLKHRYKIADVENYLSGKEGN